MRCLFGLIARRRAHAPRRDCLRAAVPDHLALSLIHVLTLLHRDPSRGTFASVVETKALSVRFATRHNI
jgi:hypothetical protein